MNAVYDQASIIAALAAQRQTLTQAAESALPERFCQPTSDKWSAADYLKHLLIAVKPIARALRQDPASLERHFGLAPNPSRTYEQIRALYQAGIDNGFRAEDAPSVLPETYRFPSDVQKGDALSETAHLRSAWEDVYLRLDETLQMWDEAALDRYQLPHPALGLLTVREILFFTLFHNSIHIADVQRVLRA